MARVVLLGGPADNQGRPGRLTRRPRRKHQRAALEAFQKTNPSEKGVTANVTDYGCHIQVDIQKEGRIVKSYSYQGGKAFEIS